MIQFNFALQIPFPSKEERSSLSFEVTSEDDFWIERSPPHCSIASISKTNPNFQSLLSEIENLAQRYGPQKIRLGKRVSFGRNKEVEVLQIQFENRNFYREIEAIHRKYDRGTKSKLHYVPHMSVFREGYKNEAVRKYFQPGMTLTVNNLFYRETSGEKFPEKFFSFSKGE